MPLECWNVFFIFSERYVPPHLRNKQGSYPGGGYPNPADPVFVGQGPQNFGGRDSYRG